MLGRWETQSDKCFRVSVEYFEVGGTFPPREKNVDLLLSELRGLILLLKKIFYASFQDLWFRTVSQNILNFDRGCSFPNLWNLSAVNKRI